MKRLHSSEAQDRTFASSEGQVTVLLPVVGVAANLLLLLVAQIGHCCTVRFKSVGDDRNRRTVALQGLLHERQGRWFISLFRDEALADLALVIHSAPAVNHLAVQLDVHFVAMPLPVAKATHTIDPLASNLACEHRAKTVPLQPHRLVAKVVTSLEKQVFHVPQTQRKPAVQHHHLADQLGCRVKVPKRIGGLRSQSAAHSRPLSAPCHGCHIPLTTPFHGTTQNVIVAMQEVAPSNMRGTFVATLLMVISLFGLGIGPAVAPAIAAMLSTERDMLGKGLAICGAVCMAASMMALLYVRGDFIREAKRGFPSVVA